jgi:hypothetical protein
VAQSKASLLVHNDLPVHIVTKPNTGDLVIASRQAKVTLDQWSPFGQTLYLDADVLVNGDVTVGFDILEAGWEMALAGSQNQDNEVFHHIDQAEREQTFRELGCSEIYQLQGGIIFFRKSAATAKLFEAWRAEWQRYKGQDQAALMRALSKSPLPIWNLGRDWNGGSLIEHRFGWARG